MNWDAIGAIGELVGAVAVFVSIIYLAIQVRHNSTDVRSGGYQSAAQSAIQIIENFVENPERRHIFQAALESYDDLDKDDEFVARMMFFQLIAYYEACYYQYVEGVVAEEVWDGRKRMMIKWFQLPGFSSWWDKWHDVWGEGFQKYVEGIRVAPPGPRPSH
ncbi:MAG: hypothetical protein ACU85U_08375 [Gammaproteobacteria bacterium]|jgi:hypothetical protein